MRQILAQRASTDSSDSFFLAVQDERIEDKAAKKNRTIDQLRVGNDASIHNLLSAQESVAVDHDSRGIGWEVASRNFDYWAAVEFADEATTEELIVVTGSFDVGSNLALNSVIESWGNPEDAACDRSFSFVEGCAHFKHVVVWLVSGWCEVLGSSSSADTGLEEAVSVDHRDNLFFHLCAHDFASLLGKSALLVVTAVDNNFERLIVSELVASNYVIKLVVATEAVAGIGAAVIAWSDGSNGVNIYCFPILLITMSP